MDGAVKSAAKVQPPPALPRPESSASNKPKPLQKLSTVLKKELHPSLILQWPGQFKATIWRAGAAMATVRHAKFNDFISGLVESCLLFTFASVFASAIFSEIGVEYVALGTGCTLLTTIVIQSSFTLFSDCALTIGGPEITPTIFLTSMAQIAKTSMQKSKAAAAAVAVATRAPAVAGRRLLAASSATLSPTRQRSLEEEEALLTTVLAIIIISSVVFGAFVYTLGRFKISKIIRLIPACVLSGYMASIGYLVLVKSMSTSMPYEVFGEGPGNPMWWAYFIPALAIGVIMYLQRRFKLGNPTIVLPILLFSPIILFYICMYGSGSNLVQASRDGWLFHAFDTGLFYNQLVFSYGRSSSVDWNAVAQAVPTMITMFFVVTLEAIMKQASTKKLLKLFDMRVDHELMLIGKANITTGLLGGVIGYPQPKLSYINYSIVRNTTSRVPGMIVTTIAAVIFFSGFPLINYLPRFWLSGVLIFAASGFIVENLYDGFFIYTYKEYLVIAAIVIINATVSMAWAVVAGIILSAIIFALTYSRQDLIKSVISGGEWRSNILRNPRTEYKLEHLGQRALIIQLHRFVFFGNASYLSEVVFGLVKGQNRMPVHLRALYFVFDWSRVENVDITASNVIYEMVTKVGAEGGRTVLFTGLDAKMKRKLIDPLRQIHSNHSLTVFPDAGPEQRCFNTLDEAMEFVENGLLQRAVQIRARWFVNHPSLEDFQVRAQFKNTYEFWEQLDYMQTFVQVPKGWSLLRAGEPDENLYVLREGSMSLLGGNVCVQRLKPDTFINEGALCGQLPMHTVVADVDSIVLALSSKERFNLEREHPATMFNLHRMVEDHLVRVKKKNTARLDVMNLWQQNQQERIAIKEPAPTLTSAVEDHGREDDLEAQQHNGDALDGANPLSSPREPVGGGGMPSPKPTLLRRAVSFQAIGANSSMLGKGATEYLLETDKLKENLVLGEEDVFDKLRDDAGEEEGMRLARRLKRRPSSVVVLNPVKGLKLLKSDEVAAAIARRMTNKQQFRAAAAAASSSEAPTEIFYHLCPVFAAHAKAAFAASAVRKDDAEPLRLPLDKLKQTLNSIGVCYHQGDDQKEEDFPLPVFLDLVVKHSMPALSREVANKLFAVCNAKTRVTEEELCALLPYTSPLTVSQFVNMWDDDRTRTLDFSSLCSAMAQYYNEFAVNAAVQADWREISMNAEQVYAEDIARAFNIDMELAQEMVWEADYAGNDWINLNMVLETLSL